MPQNDTAHPDYYHKVVDCQWACPAHTNVPGYIRLIAAGKYSEAYLLNRSSNVFPGILGRVCDRPCEPACRRGRLDAEEPVAICRLKRVAADFRDDITARLPKAPFKKNGKRVALIGAGPASLTVANDLAPLGYQITLFEKDPKLGGAMRVAVPSFRLPEKVLDDEIGYITGMDVEVRAGQGVTSMKALLAQGFDAVFVGTGAPLGRDLKIPGREDAGKNVHIGLNWLANVAFEHVKQIGKRVLVIGGGNTAMDCARTSRRLGGNKIMCVAPEGFEQMLASPWEKEDAIEEGVEFHNNLLPQSFVVENARLKGVLFQPLKSLFDENRKWAPVPADKPPVLLECDDVILAIGQNTAYDFVEKDIGIQFQANGLPVVDAKTYRSTHEKVYFGGDAAFGPRNIITAVAQAHEAAISIHLALSGQNVQERPAPGINLLSQKMGLHEWSYDNEVSNDERMKMAHVNLQDRFKELSKEVELGFDVQQAFKEAERCLNCDVQTVFTASACIECDACVDICPTDCLTMTPDGSNAEIGTRLSAPRLEANQPMMVSSPLTQTGRVMVKDENVCLHCGLCAERCPTGAWDMQRMQLTLPYMKVFGGNNTSR